MNFFIRESEPEGADLCMYNGRLGDTNVTCRNLERVNKLHKCRIPVPVLFRAESGLVHDLFCINYAWIIIW